MASFENYRILVLLFLGLFSLSAGNIIRSHGPLSASFGERTIISKSTLKVRPSNGDRYCMINVLYNEGSLDASVGRLFPASFPCNFKEGDVYYEHFGLPMLQHSSVELLVTYVTEQSERISLPISIKVEVSEPSDRIVYRNQGLSVETFNGYSQPIASSNLGINFHSLTQSCYISLLNGASAHSWPR